MVERLSDPLFRDPVPQLGHQVDKLALVFVQRRLDVSCKLKKANE